MTSQQRKNHLKMQMLHIHLKMVYGVLTKKEETFLVTIMMMRRRMRTYLHLKAEKGSDRTFQVIKSFLMHSKNLLRIKVQVKLTRIKIHHPVKIKVFSRLEMTHLVVRTAILRNQKKVSIIVKEMNMMMNIVRKLTTQLKILLKAKNKLRLIIKVKRVNKK